MDGRTRKAPPRKAGLDVVLTYVDDLFDPSMRDAIGADSARALQSLDRLPATFVVEDPATVWNLGPERYPEIARRYHPLTSHWDRVGVDINVVEREPPVYPTRTQVAPSFFELIHTSSSPSLGSCSTTSSPSCPPTCPGSRPPPLWSPIATARAMPAHRLSLRSGNSLGRPCDSGRPPVARARP